MRRISPILLVSVVLLAGCSDEEMRAAGRRIEGAIAERWESFRQDMDDRTKAQARLKADARETARAEASARAEARIRQEDVAAVAAMTAAKPVKLNPAVLEEVAATARQQRAQSLVVKFRGKTVLDRRWGRQDELHAMMQMTYPIVALTMGQLVAEGKIPSLDTPLGHWLPAFREGKKSRITLRHVMTGRDGLTGPEPWPAGLYRQPDYIKFYAGTPSRDEPGPGQVLPRESVVLLGAVVQSAAGMPLDRWVATRLFEPLGIMKSRWRKDKAGHVDAWAGLWLPPAGALKIGELVLHEGRWNGRQVLPRAWVIEATSPAWRSDVPEFTETHGYGWRTGTKFRPGPAGQNWIKVADRRFGFQASDFIGNHLIVYPTQLIEALLTVPWDGRPVTRSIDDFEFDDLADRLDEAVE